MEIRKNPKRYDLTVYFTIDGCGYPIIEKCFRSFDKMIRYCADFNDEYCEILFDCYDADRGQYNINDIVEVFKYA